MSSVLACLWNHLLLHAVNFIPPLTVLSPSVISTSSVKSQLLTSMISGLHILQHMPHAGLGHRSRTLAGRHPQPTPRRKHWWLSWLLGLHGTMITDHLKCPFGYSLSFTPSWKPTFSKNQSLRAKSTVFSLLLLLLRFFGFFLLLLVSFHYFLCLWYSAVYSAYYITLQSLQSKNRLISWSAFARLIYVIFNTHSRRRPCYVRTCMCVAICCSKHLKCIYFAPLLGACQFLCLLT